MGCWAHAHRRDDRAGARAANNDPNNRGKIFMKIIIDRNRGKTANDAVCVLLGGRQLKYLEHLECGLQPLGKVPVRWHPVSDPVYKSRHDCLSPAFRRRRGSDRGEIEFAK